MKKIVRLLAAAGLVASTVFVMHRRHELAADAELWAAATDPV